MPQPKEKDDKKKKVQRKVRAKLDQGKRCQGLEEEEDEDEDEEEEDEDEEEEERADGSASPIP
jgi:hypothetical protein